MPPDTPHPCLRHWAIFPRLTGQSVRLSSPQTFWLMLESAAGRLVVASVSLRTAPDESMAVNLARLVDAPELAEMSPVRIEVEFEDRHGVSVKLLDVDLDRDDPVARTGVVPRMLAEAVNACVGKPMPSTLRKEITARITAEWDGTRSRFISALDAAAVAQARAAGALTPDTYTYVNTVAAEIRRNRAQAVELFPLLQPLLMMPAYDDIRKVIDAGRPLVDVLGAKWNAPKALIRNLKGITFRDIGISSRELATVVRLLRAIPPDWWPRNRETWHRFGQRIDTIGKLSKRPVTTPANLLWLRECARQGYVGSDRTQQEYARISEEIEDFLDMLRRALAWTQAEMRRLHAGASLRTPFETVAALRTSIDLEKLAHIAHRFGNAYRRAEEAYAYEAELLNGVRWPVIGNVVRRSYAGVVVHALQTPADLREEGQRMGNCVASYAGLCMRGIAQIWSLRLDAGEPLSTLETRMRSTSNGRIYLHVAQHKGVGNQPPPPAATRALDDFLADLMGHTAEMGEYSAWRQKVVRRPLSERQQYALMQPVITALRQTLPRRWAWDNISMPYIEYANGKDS